MTKADCERKADQAAGKLDRLIAAHSREAVADMLAELRAFRTAAREWFPDGQWSMEQARDANLFPTIRAVVDHGGRRMMAIYMKHLILARRAAFLRSSQVAARQDGKTPTVGLTDALKESSAVPATPRPVRAPAPPFDAYRNLRFAEGGAVAWMEGGVVRMRELEAPHAKA